MATEEKEPKAPKRRRRKRRMMRKQGVMPCNPRFCWNCGVPQPKEVSL